ncbi:MAG: hypothetical protein DMF73_12910 [Acidobacteria bacterium]|nr:MAG: hypothetical protein DMF73_12910 [Acidobacteriota bacterium]
MTVSNYYRRNLPHWHPSGVSIFLTWRLDGSLPLDVIEKLTVMRRRLRDRTRKVLQEDRLVEYKKLFARVDTILDRASSGPLWLGDKRIAELVQDALVNRYAGLYLIWAYVVMANHIHVLLRPKNHEISISTITKNLKGYSSREANRLLKRTGQRFWQDESFDHWSRNASEFARIVKYIENNPVKAGLVREPEQWEWSSAAERKRRGLTTF